MKMLETLSWLWNEHSVNVFHYGKKYAHIWQSFDCMQMYISHIDCDDTENIATKDKVIQIVTSC